LCVEADAPNDLCGKILAGTGLTYHTYPCTKCIQDTHRRFGLDFLEAWLDDIIDATEAQARLAAKRATEVVPDAKADELDRIDAERRRQAPAAAAAPSQALRDALEAAFQRDPEPE
jgi:hypothetical protein